MVNILTNITDVIILSPKILIQQIFWSKFRSFGINFTNVRIERNLGNRNNLYIKYLASYLTIFYNSIFFKYNNILKLQVQPFILATWYRASAKSISLKNIDQKYFFCSIVHSKLYAQHIQLLCRYIWFDRSKICFQLFPAAL